MRSHQFDLILPFDTAYVTIARLVIAGIANHLGFSFDELEDIKIVVGEACNICLTQKPKSKPSSLSFHIVAQKKQLELNLFAHGIFLEAFWRKEVQRSSRGAARDISSVSILKRLVDACYCKETREGSQIRLVKKLKKR